jgi:hypothetical protein
MISLIVTSASRGHTVYNQASLYFTPIEFLFAVIRDSSRRRQCCYAIAGTVGSSRGFVLLATMLLRYRWRILMGSLKPKRNKSMYIIIYPTPD